MSDTTATREWGEFRSADEANRSYILPDEDAGYVFRIDDCPPATESPFIDFDDKGKEKPRKWQSLMKFTIVDYANDDPDRSVIGQQITQFYTISMHTKSNFYKLAKAVFGGEVDPNWKPNADQMKGKIISGSIGHKEPNKEDKVYPKITQTLPYRGKKTYDDVQAIVRDKENTKEVPF